MESVIKCFDVVGMVVDEASEQFKPLWSFLYNSNIGNSKKEG